LTDGIFRKKSIICSNTIDKCINCYYIIVVESGSIIEWDESKRQSNLAKHGVDFNRATELNFDKAITGDQIHGNETRHVVLAPIAARVYVLVWTERAGVMRIISLRKANTREVADYEKIHPPD